MAEIERADAAPEAGEHLQHHPGPKFYIMIGVILTVVTAVEIAVYYIEALDDWEAHIILPLSALKFILVVLFYMHLRFDSKLFSAVFLAPLTLGVLVIISLVILFHVLPFFPGG